MAHAHGLARAIDSSIAIIRGAWFGRQFRERELPRDSQEFSRDIVTQYGGLLTQIQTGSGDFQQVLLPVKNPGSDATHLLINMTDWSHLIFSIMLFLRPPRLKTS